MTDSDILECVQDLVDNPDETYIAWVHEDLDTKNLQAFTEALKNSSKLEKVFLLGNNLARPATPAADISTLIQALATHCPKLAGLSLCANFITDSHLQEVVDAFKEHSCLEGLEIRVSLITWRGGSVIAELLRSDVPLKDLELSMCNDDGHREFYQNFYQGILEEGTCDEPGLGDKGCIAIASGLEGNQSLTTLTLTDDAIGHRGCKSLMQAVTPHPALQTLYLNDNPLGYEGALAIAEYLETNPSLTHVGLSSCDLTDKGSIAIGRALAKGNTNFTGRLDVTSNDIGSDGACALAEWLEKGHGTFLVIDKNKIGVEGAEALAKAAATSDAVTRLDFIQCEIGESSADSFAKYISRTSLTHLDLRGNNISDTAGAAFVHALAQWGNEMTLTQLFLDNNPIASQTSTALYNMLTADCFTSAKPLTLRYVSMYGTDLDDTGICDQLQSLKGTIPEFYIGVSARNKKQKS